MKEFKQTIQQENRYLCLFAWDFLSSSSGSSQDQLILRLIEVTQGAEGASVGSGERAGGVCTQTEISMPERTCAEYLLGGLSNLLGKRGNET